MAFAITSSCCADTSCVQVCPVNCIHPAPGEPEFGTTDILYVDPRSCIDCGACADACPAGAIKPVDLLRGGEAVFADINAAYYDGRPEVHVTPASTHLRVLDHARPGLRVAVVGTGPAASYAARELLGATSSHVSIIDRLPVPGGLLRGGIAPDHVDTKGVLNAFEWTYEHPRARMFMNVEVGTHVTHDELLEYHDAVIYAVGAPADRPIGFDGEDLNGVHGSVEMVGWYNVDPEVAVDAVKPRGHRVFVVGNGNVALDIARILLGDPERLAATDMSRAAIEAIWDADIREVVLLGRRGPQFAAFTRPELLALPPGMELVVEGDDATRAEIEGAAPGSAASHLQGVRQVASNWTTEPAPGRRLVLAFNTRVQQAHGDEALESVTLAGPHGIVEAPVQLLVTATGRRGRPIAGLPFDAERAVVSNERGRVIDPASGEVVPGAYVIGWARRGATGGIGANRVDALDVVRMVADDSAAGRLRQPTESASAFARLVRRRQPQLIDGRGVQRIRRHEQETGAKLTTIRDLVRTAR